LLAARRVLLRTSSVQRLVNTKKKKAYPSFKSCGGDSIDAFGVIGPGSDAQLNSIKFLAGRSVVPLQFAPLSYYNNLGL